MLGYWFHLTFRFPFEQCLTNIRKYFLYIFLMNPLKYAILNCHACIHNENVESNNKYNLYLLILTTLVLRTAYLSKINLINLIFICFPAWCDQLGAHTRRCGQLCVEGQESGKSITICVYGKHNLKQRIQSMHQRLHLCGTYLCQYLDSPRSL